MQKINCGKYSDFIRYAADNCCGKVYPLSVSQGFQYGDIFAENTGGETVLFWHYCGFAYISGKISEAFLEDVYGLMLNKNNARRFILMTDNEETERFFQSKNGVCTERRYLFEYTEKCPPEISVLPSGFEIKEINGEILSKIQGGIVPSIFWDSPKNFIKNGKGFCISDRSNIAAWAFSAAVSSSEIDIGIETAENYRGHGIAIAAAKMMIRYAFEAGKSPVWACHYSNVPSKRLAEKIGFAKISECSIIKKDVR